MSVNGIASAGLKPMDIACNFENCYNATFVMDPGITDPRVQMFGPVVSTVPGPIAVWDVQIVG